MLITANATSAMLVTVRTSKPVSVRIIERMTMLAVGLWLDFGSHRSVALALSFIRTRSTLSFSALAENNIVLGELVSTNAVCAPLLRFPLKFSMRRWSENLKMFRVTANFILTYVMEMMAKRDLPNCQLVNQPMN